MAKLGSATTIAAATAAVFGTLTLVSGGTALFGSQATRDLYGNTVPFVLWFNFLAGGAYLIAAWGLFRSARWAAWLAAAIALATLAVAAAFALTVLSGSPYEPRTVGALALRSLFWIVVAWFSLNRTPHSGTDNRLAS